MRNYVEAKINEYREKLAGQRAMLTQLDIRGEHANILEQLRSVCAASELALERTHKALELGLPQLLRRHQVNLTRVRARLELLEEWYLPVLLSEGDEECAVTRIVTQLLNQLNVGHLKDKVVSFSRALSMYPGLQNNPIFFMPRYTFSSLLDWTGLYHEIGHAVYQNDPQIAGLLSKAVFSYCQEQLRNLPALSTSQLDERADRIRQTFLYWNKYRLEELFCDIFATAVAGPAHLLSWIDVSLTSPQNPYEINLADEHPPHAVRTEACMLGLDEGYADSPLKKSICGLWDEFLQRRPKPPLYKQLCPFSLIMGIVQNAKTEIVRHGFPIFRKALPLPPDSLSYEATNDLQELVNIAAVNFRFAPSNFSDWQRKITSKLFIM